MANQLVNLPPAFELRPGTLTPAQLDQAVEIFYQAFRLKIHHLELFARDRKQALRILRASFVTDSAFFAFEGQRLVGLVGIEHAGRRFLQVPPAALRAEFSAWGGLWRRAWWNISHAYQRPRAGELCIEAIAIDAQLRGRGIGTLLMERACAYARQAGCRAVTLEVVDSNPRARKLYEQLGFTVRKEERYGPITARAGLRGVAFMRKILDKN